MDKNQVCWKCKFDGKGLYHKFFINGKTIFLCANCFEDWRKRAAYRVDNNVKFFLEVTSNG